MAPDSATLDSFNVNDSDVVHAVLAKEGRGAQARMLRRLNNAHGNNGGNNTNNTSGINIRRNLYSNPTDSESLSRLWRRIGIDASGVVVTREQGESESEESEAEGDVETGERRTGRERRGFDRLRSTGMSRDEVNIIRSYFARSVDQYIERRRILIRASAQLRNSLGAGNSGRDRLDTGDSSNSLLDNGSEENEDDRDVTEANNTNQNRDGDNENANVNTPVEGEDILLDRLRMEDEWMSTQGPYSEFRMNLNTSNPLLLAAISGHSPNNPSLSNFLSGSGRNRRGLLSRRNGTNTNDSEEDEEDLMFSSLGSNPMLLPNTNSPFRPYMSPLPSVGTDKDFFWGFMLGFFVGFIMLFWVWMPTVPHKQKIGIISGVICQLMLNLLRKSGEAEAPI